MCLEFVAHLRTMSEHGLPLWRWTIGDPGVIHRGRRQRGATVHGEPPGETLVAINAELDPDQSSLRRSVWQRNLYRTCEPVASTRVYRNEELFLAVAADVELMRHLEDGVLVRKRNRLP